MQPLKLPLTKWVNFNSPTVPRDVENQVEKRPHMFIRTAHYPELQTEKENSQNFHYSERLSFYMNSFFFNLGKFSGENCFDCSDVFK